MLNIENAVTRIAVAGPNIIKLAKVIPKLTETLPVLGRGVFELSAAKDNIPNKTTPKIEIFLYLKRMKLRDTNPAINIK
jgi:hypothetical protein